MDHGERSLVRISTDDLQRLGDIARLDREGLFKRRPQYQALAGKIMAVALCQGAALHYIDGKNGIKDFDVWTFYARHPEVKYPQRRYMARDFGDPKFGKSPDTPEYAGRRVDLLGRSLDVDAGADPVETLKRYFTEGKSKTARLLAQKAVVLIEPVELLGFVVWQPEA